MNYIINYLIITLPEFYIFILFSIILFGYDLSAYKYKILFMAAISALVSDYLWFIDLEVNLRVLATFITIFILYIVFIRANWILSLLMTIASFIALIILEVFILTLILQFVSIDLILQSLMVKFIVVYIEFLPLIITIYIMYKNNWNFSKLANRIQNNKIAVLWFTIFFLIVMQTCCIIYFNYTRYVKENITLKEALPITYYILFISVFIIFMNLLLIKVVVNLKNKYTEIEVLKTESDYNENLEKLLVKLRMERHDNISQIQALYGMVSERKYDMLKEYLGDIVENIKSSSINHSFNIKNIPVSAFLHTKMEQIKALDIDFKIVVNTSDNFKEIKGVDLIKIVSNILDNAIRAVSDNDIEDPFIEFCWDKENNNAVIKISNNGPKINKKDVALIFKEGYTTKTEKTNSGYGLAIVRSIVNKYKGNIEVISNREITSFIVKLPLSS